MSDEVRKGRFGRRTRIAYDAFYRNRQFLFVKRNTTVALRVVFFNITCSVFCHFMFHKGRLAMPGRRRG